MYTVFHKETTRYLIAHNRVWFSRLLHQARKRSGSILSAPERARGLLFHKLCTVYTLLVYFTSQTTHRSTNFRVLTLAIKELVQRTTANDLWVRLGYRDEVNRA